MRKSTTQDDLKNADIPKLMYDIKNRCLIKWDGLKRFGWSFHHFVKQQIFQRNPQKYKDIQKLIYLPTMVSRLNLKKGYEEMLNMHAEADNNHSRFFERWGVKIESVIYKE